MRKFFRVFAIFVFSCCMFVAKSHAKLESPSFDAEPVISMDFQDASLKDILKILSIQSGLNFIATEALQERKITLYLDKVPLKEAMDKLFKANNLSYELDRDSNIFLVKDWGKPEIETITKIFFLKYATVSSSALTKQKQRDTSACSVTATGATGSTAGSTNTQTEETGITLVVKKLLSEHGSLVEDSRTNSFTITDIPSRMPIIEKTIAALDVPTLSVMLEVEMLDVSKNTIDKLGFEFGENPFTLILPGGFARRGAQFNILGSGASFGETGAVTLGRTYASLLDYLRTQTDTKYLARPRILILNNETAEIAVAKDEIVGYNQDVQVTDTGTLTTITYIRATDLKLTPEGTGIILRVTPQINPQTNEITMAINPKSSVTSTSISFPSQADAEVRTTKSIVKVRDSETIILGGLLHQDKNLTVKKLPILSDIPFIGALFRHKDVTKDIERELLVFITPHIIKDINNIDIAQARKLVIPAREQNVASGLNRQFSINTLLDTFEKK
jgi:type IV pilus assembly protein PilQ